MKNILLLVFLFITAGSSAQVINFTYDNLNRVTQVTYPDNSSISYTYDAVGNRISSVVTNPLISTVKETTADNNSMSLYPNPNNGSFDLYFNSSLENAELLVYNSFGQKVFSQTSSQKRQTFNIFLGDLPEGIYFIQIVSNQGVQTKKFVIAK